MIIPFKVAASINHRFSCTKMKVVEPKSTQLNRKKDVALVEPKTPPGSLKVRLDGKTMVTITPTPTMTVEKKLEQWKQRYPKLEVIGKV